MARANVVIIGAAGRDFHNFNTHYRGDPTYRVVAFTATQIPNIADRRYPAALAGPLYPEGIPIFPEEELEELIARERVDQGVLSYSDLAHTTVMHIASRVLAAGADFVLLGPHSTMLEARVPVVSIGAVRTGSGKSQTTRRVVEIVKGAGMRPVVIRHPMPYGDLAAQACQRFATYEDLERHHCTIEEREEYEPHIQRGTVVYAGVDYRQILDAAEREADVVVWDGGNNDLPFIRPDLHIVVADPHRAGHELLYHPGETNLRMADVVVINKVDTAPPEGLETVRRNVRAANPGARVIEAASPVSVEDPDAVRGKRVLVVEDGPTLTHGEMAYGAGVVAAQKFGAAEVVDPRPYAVGTIRETFERFPHLGAVLPAMGYGDAQVDELRRTIEATPADLVLVATPINLARLLHLNKPSLRVTYELAEVGAPTLGDVVGEWLRGLAPRG